MVRIHQGVGNGGSILEDGPTIFFTEGNKTWDLNSLDIQLVAGQVYTAIFYAVSGAPTFEYEIYTGIDYYPGGALWGAGASMNDMFFWASITGLSNTLTPVDMATEVSRI
ncbi:MAG: hypothetical protein HRT71_12560 [Flavobacteriales bacterium]|nr:hypothetical protein [Flavobacteriales bacterium]